MEPSRNEAGEFLGTAGSPGTRQTLAELDRLLTSTPEKIKPGSPEKIKWGEWERNGERIPIGLERLLDSLGTQERKRLDDLQKVVEDAKRCVDAPDAPILAVMGLLNAGKSSLIGSCLSEQGRRRILIGSGNREGTHRFILWLPSQWKSNSLVWGYVQSRLLGAFPAGFEFLSDDAERASEQYNDLSIRTTVHFDAHQSTSSANSAMKVSAMEIPLVAFDEGLDRLQMALMDCPDVQTGIVSFSTSAPMDSATSSPSKSDMWVHRAEQFAQKRMEVLTRAAPICSAFVIVLPANALHDQKVSELMQSLRARMPHTLQIAAVNRVPRRYTTDEIREEMIRLYGERNLERVYMAYGYDGPQQRERLPSPPECFEPSISGELYPLFFRIDHSPCPQPPGSMREGDWFFSLGRELPGASLLRDAVHSHAASLLRQWNETSEKVQQLVQSASQRREEVRRVLAEACLDFSRDPASASRIRLQASHKIVEQISSSLERTAPWWARPGRWTSKLAEYGKSQAQQLGEWLRLPAWIGGKTEGLLRYIRSRWSSNEGAQVVSAESLFRSIQRLDDQNAWHIDAPLVDASNSSLPHRWLVQKLQQGIHRFQLESSIELDNHELDALTSQMWNQMPWGKRLATGLAPAAILFAPLIAVIMLPFDFGGSSVLVFASVKELLGAGVAGLGFALLSPDQMPKIAESEAAWKQLGDLVAALCDTLELERPSESHPISLRLGESWKVLPFSSISKHVSTTNSTPELESSYGDSMNRLVPPAIRIDRSTFQRFESLCRSLLEEW